MGGFPVAQIDARARTRARTVATDSSDADADSLNSEQSRWPGGTGAYTCSADLVANHSEVPCDYCCPVNVTELHYLHHPEDCTSQPCLPACLPACLLHSLVS
jgi:hypothetical protein